MKYRDIELYYQQALDNVGTKILDLKTSEPISAMRLSFYGTNGSASNKSNFINDVITKIELVDGSDQLLSLSLKEAQAIQFRRTGKMPYMRPGETNGGSQEESAMLLFGRYLWDKEYYMDLTKFRNPQLKITTNIAAVRPIGTDAFATGTLKVTIDLLTIPEGAEAAKGFIMQKNIYSFTSGTSGDEPVKMPMDYPYLGVLMRAYAAGNDIDENISKVKLNCDTGKFIPIEKYVKDLYKAEEEDLGPAEIHYFIYRINAETVYHPLNHDPIIALTPTNTKRLVSGTQSWSGKFILYFTDETGAAITTEELIHLIVKGSCPHSTIYLPFGKQDLPETYFDPKIYGDIDLLLSQKAASAVDVVLAQLRPYGAAA